MFHGVWEWFYEKVIFFFSDSLPFRLTTPADRARMPGHSDGQRSQQPPIPLTVCCGGQPRSRVSHESRSLLMLHVCLRHARPHRLRAEQGGWNQIDGASTKRTRPRCRPLQARLAMPTIKDQQAKPEPLIASQGVIQFDTKIQVCAEVDGRIELIATPLPPRNDVRCERHHDGEAPPAMKKCFTAG